MKLARLTSLVAGLLILTLAGIAGALEPPRIIPHAGHVNQPPSQVFGTLKRFFSDPSLSRFQLTQANQSTGTIVATQKGIDNERWNQWAACKTGPMHMLDQLSSGDVTLRIKLEPSPGKTTFVTVSADFEGTYVLGQQTTVIPCRSTGVLENNILSAAGVPQTSQPAN